jgi:hypothetical protein
MMIFEPKKFGNNLLHLTAFITKFAQLLLFLIIGTVFYYQRLFT